MSPPNAHATGLSRFLIFYGINLTYHKTKGTAVTDDPLKALKTKEFEYFLHLGKLCDAALDILV